MRVEKRIVLINSAASAIKHVINLGLLIWLQRFLLQNIPVEEYAVYILIVQPMVLLPLLLGALNNAVGRFVVLHLSQGDEESATRVVSTTCVLSTLLALMLAVPAALLYVWIEPVLRIDPSYVDVARTMFVMLFGVSVMQTVTAPLVVGPFVRQKFVLSSLLVLGTQILRMAFIVAFLLLIEVHVVWVVVATVIAESIGVIASIAVTRRLLPGIHFRLSAVSRSTVGVLTAFSGWSFLKTLPITVRRAAEPVVLNRLGGAFDVTCFHLGSLVFSQIQMLFRNLMSPLQPPLVALYARGDRIRLRGLYLRINRLALMLTMLIVLPSILFHRELVVLYVGEEFLDAGTAMALMMAQLPIRFSSIMAGTMAPAMDRLRPLARFTWTINLSLLIALGATLAMGYGVVEAAAAYLVVAAIVVPTLLWPLGWSLADVKPGEWFRRCVLPSAIPSAAGAGTWIALKGVVAPDSWTELFLCFVGGAVVYLATLYVFSTTTEDRDDLRATIRKLTSSLRPANAGD